MQNRGNSPAPSAASHAFNRPKPLPRQAQPQATANRRECHLCEKQPDTLFESPQSQTSNYQLPNLKLFNNF